MHFPESLHNCDVPLSNSDPRQPDAPLIYVNRAFEASTGYARESILEMNCRFLQDAAPAPIAVRKKIREVISKPFETEVLLTNNKATGTRFENYLRLKPVMTHAGTPMICRCQFDLSAVMKNEAVERHLKSESDTAEELYERINEARLTAFDIRCAMAFRRVSEHLE